MPIPEVMKMFGIDEKSLRQRAENYADEFVNSQNIKTTTSIAAIMEILIEKEIFSEHELNDRIDSLTQDVIDRQVEQVKIQASELEGKEDCVSTSDRIYFQYIVEELIEKRKEFD